MAFFKFRKDGEDHASPASAPESIESLRKRARYRLAGAAILVLAGVIGFPLLFDNQPRPIAVDIPIVIPDKAQSKPLSMASASSSVATASSEPTAEPSATQGTDSTGKLAAAGVAVATTATAAATAVAKAESPILTETKDGKELKAGKDAKDVKDTKEARAAKDAKSAKEGNKDAAKDGSKDATKTAAAKEAKPHPDAARAQALLEGKAPTAAADSGRFVVQFGSFADATRAHEARLKVEKAGFKTYAQVAQGADGKRFRVRVGPFTQRAEAEKAAEKIKKLDLTVSILAL